MDNAPPDWKGRVIIEAEDYEGPSELVFDGKQGAFPGDKRPIGHINGLYFTSLGAKFITVRDPESGIIGKSNAIVVTERPPAMRLFWGDLHSQTIFSDGLRCPEELYAFARDEAFLDIFALADHSEFLTDDQWDYFVAVTNRFNHAKNFVTLVGLEWTHHAFGHRNIYYPGDFGPILRCTDPIDGQLERIYRVAREHGALVIPHHSANVTMGEEGKRARGKEGRETIAILPSCPLASLRCVRFIQSGGTANDLRMLATHTQFELLGAKNRDSMSLTL